MKEAPRQTPQKIVQEIVLADKLRAFSHSARLEILRVLAHGCTDACCCADVTGSLPLAQSTVSQHIKVLLDAGLIVRHARGTRNLYSVNADALAEVKASFDLFMAGLDDPRACETPVLPSTEKDGATG